MWKKLYELLEQVFTLSQRVAHHDKQIEEVRKEVRELSAAVYRLAAKQEAERESTRLWIENTMLRYEQKQLTARRDESGADQS